MTGCRSRHGGGRATRASDRSGRAQANLLVVAVALVVLVAVTATAVAVAEAALASAERDAPERRAATTAADRLVAADASVTRRENVLDRDAAADLTADDVTALAPPLADAAFRVRIGDLTVVERGDPTGGTTVRRIALLADTDERTATLALDEERSATLPRRTDRLTFRFDPDADAETVRVNGRVVLHDPDGLAGETTVPVSRFDTLEVRVEGSAGDVTVTSYPETTNKVLVEVTVDA